MKIRQVGILGCGLMGSGIAEVCAKAGVQTIIREMNADFLDKSMKLGLGYPMGPFTLLDSVGLDTTSFIANIMFEEYRERRFAPPPLLKQMEQAGRLGRKSGRGFYDYGS